MKVAALQYQYSFPEDFASYKEKITQIVASIKEQEVDLLLFPEYAGCEMLSFVDIENLDKYLLPYLALFEELAYKHQMIICNGSQLVGTSQGVRNRSYLFTPNKTVSYQDKCVLTPYEHEEGLIKEANELRVFDTDLAKIGICICYDAEFDQLARRLVQNGAEILLVPSYTSSMHGYWRVFLSSRARALENQCYVVQSSLVGKTDVEIAYGASNICSPVDEGFSEEGIVAQGTLNEEVLVVATLDLEKLSFVRQNGKTRNFKDAEMLLDRNIGVERIKL